MDFPEKVYKYRTWENDYHKNILLNNELYLASPKDINDPFDCRIAPNYISLTSSEKEEYIKELLIKKYEELQSTGYDLGKVSKNLDKRMADPQKFQFEIDKYTFNLQDKHYGILCLSIRWNGILMWSHYSDCHKGFCVGYRTKKLWDTGLFGKAALVNYDTKYPDLKPFVAKKPADLNERAFIQTHTKSEDWTYEDEFRFVNVIFPKELTPTDRLIQVPDETLAEVILGINISNNDKDEIIELCKRKKIPVYQAKKKNFMFEIDRDLIQ